METYDLVIIGAGPGGYVAAVRGARLGARVLLIERDAAAGGVCLHRGCIPTKSMLSAAKVYELCRRGGEFGITAEKISADLARIVARADKSIRLLGGGLDALLKNRKIERLQGTARLAPKRQIIIDQDGDQTTVAARAIILATGSRPAELPGLETDGEQVVNSDQLVRLERQPRRLAIVGGGVTGCEFASLFSMLGSEVSIVEIEDSLLPGFDQDVRPELGRAFKKRKMHLYLGDKVKEHHRSADGVTLLLESGRTVAADLVLVAVGRRPNVEALDLAAAGIETDRRGFIPVDDFARTSAHGIYAIGDINGLWQLAHAASHQGTIAVEHALGHNVSRALERRAVPAAVYCDPEIGTVGLTEAQARESVGRIQKGVFQIRTLGRAHAGGEIEGIYKVLAEADTGQILGVHIVAHGASELVHAATIALSHEATLESVAGTIHGHPTYGEAFKEACELALGRPVHG